MKNVSEKKTYEANIQAALEKLIRFACKLGANDAKSISTEKISVETNLANLCREPQCENYGLSASCPPYVAGPEIFRKVLTTFKHSVFFKIDVPSEVLFSDERREIFKLLHEIGAGIELKAVKMGFNDSKAYVGGSCKEIFCREYPNCRVVVEKGKCRNPLSARPSMSGFGINVLKLKKEAGWISDKTQRYNDPDTASMETICGLVLIG